MKKTMIALLALSSVACATTIDLSSEQSGTLVVHLDVVALQDIAGDGFGGAVDAITLFCFNGKWQNEEAAALGIANNGSSTSHETGIYNYWIKAGQIANNQDFQTTTLKNFFTSSTDWNDIADITIAYSWDSTDTVTNIYAAISRLANDGTVTTMNGSLLNQMKFGNIPYLMTVDSLTVNDTYVVSYEHQVASVMSAEGIKTLAESALVPEPATATLSLLALAGLCARRRRH